MAEEGVLGLELLLRRLTEASDELTSSLGDEFIGLMLFGSWARGEAKADSDVDLLIVLRSMGGMDTRSRIYKTLSKHVRRPITLIDMRLERLLDEELELTPLLINVLADGIIVRDDEGYLRDFLERGRRLLEEAELVRYRTPDGKYGWRRRDGKPIAPTRI